MSLSQEGASVTPSTSGSPVVMSGNVSVPDTSTDLGRFAEVSVQFANDIVDNLLTKLEGLEKEVAVTLIELDLAIDAQAEAHKNMPDYLDLSAVNLDNALALNLDMELNLSSSSPASLPTTTNSAGLSSIPVSVIVSVAASTAVGATTSTRRPTLLSPRVTRPVPGLLPVGPAKRSSKGSSSLKPSK